MKATLKYGIASYSGTIDDITFASYKNGAVCIARKYVMPTLTDNNATMGAVTKNLSEIYGNCSEDYKSDLRTYADMYNKERVTRTKLGSNSFSLFVKLMYAFAEDTGESVDLASITYSDLKTMFFDVASVASAVEAEYLPKVSGYELLVNTI
ncbi:MAG: hypothetical protein WCQ59_03250 [Candidatus Cloacimonadaceae bacterium]|jgi:hypothetical protein|nr:hypothetical protein [Candidatus Cloacimonadota bacterium]MDD4560157.1 hypothetical protein [Candidatus Cloacimonadota bacterium]